MQEQLENVSPDDSFSEKLLLLSSSRIFIALTLLIATLIIRPGGQNAYLYNAFLFVTICHVFISIFFFFFEKIISKKFLHRFAFMQIAWDILFHTSIVYLTGGISSQYKFLYWISIMFCSILFLRTGAIVAAALSALFYAAMLDLEYYQNLPQFFKAFSHFRFSSEKTIIDSMLLNTLVFSFVGFMCSVITTKLSRAEASILQHEQKVRDLEEKVMKSKHLASVGEMAARIAHEIRNPLTSVSASMEMLSKKENEGSNEGMILNIAKKEAKRLNQLLTDFLDYARPNQPSFENQYLSELINDSIHLFLQGSPEIMIHFENKIARELPIQLDARRISQLFWNIYKNAAESMNEKGKISIKLREDRDTWYMIEVEDEGIGFDSKNREKIFEPFFSSKSKGTGLGLSIAYRVMQDHRGMIELESLPVKGCVCRLTFPIQFGEPTHA